MQKNGIKPGGGKERKIEQNRTMNISYPKEYRTMNIFDRKENRTLKTYVNKMQTGGDPGPIRLG